MDDTGVASAPIEELNDVLAGRYRVERVLGEGAHGVTYLALTADGRRVALKELAVERVESWKALELFEREGQALRALSHPAIPAYEEAFHLDDGWGGERFFLAQAYVEGRALGSEVERGRRWTEAQVKALVEELLEVLAYIQALSPAMIHRDIKPSNLMERPDGSLALIDFGAVQTLAAEETGGSTIVGTTGYMPVEQLMGRAVPATDLYAVGATAVHLLSGRHPADLPVRRMALDFRGAVNVSEPFGRFLDGMLAPDVEDRYRTAREALEALEALGGPVTLRVARASMVSVLSARRHAMARKVVQSLSSRAASRSNSPGRGARQPVVARVSASQGKAVRRGDRGSGARGGWFVAVAFVSALVFGSNCGRFSAKLSGYEEVVFGPLQTCGPVEELLGQDIGVPAVGCQTGSTQTSSGGGSAAWHMPVSGSKGRGSYSFTANKNAHGTWELRGGLLKVEERVIDVVRCVEMSTAQARRTPNPVEDSLPGAAR
ncbi:hypothetical protein EA187_18970 [Lujinxingia sediminis]|uniref:non-specific serine/threonine protein kinase n=1 Tax=Lujinxingia sediminis TaxID=2480984 RepID=A0ABY0CN91_9DELT|nr:cytochrome c oxidase assembly factor Coa1 family protein [Lujinxingia sediminis]RVU41427.1 hypothetical protein EA187_18970 [Lujinxingia sediminis]